jgi:hypothetical protein
MGRIDPVGPVQAYKTYGIYTPLATHFRAATCAEVECSRYLNGWETRVDETTDLGQAQAHYIRRDSGRGFSESRDAGLTVFRFEPGQRCFASDTHRTRIERPEIFIARGGDHRGNPTGQVTKHTSPAHWVEDFAEHQQRIADEIERG